MKKGITADILTIVLLVVVLAIAIILYLLFSQQGKEFLSKLFGLRIVE